MCGIVQLTDEQVELYKDIPLFPHRVGGVYGRILYIFEQLLSPGILDLELTSAKQGKYILPPLKR